MIFAKIEEILLNRCQLRALPTYWKQKSFFFSTNYITFAAILIKTADKIL